MKQPTNADLMKKLEELEREIKELKARPVFIYYPPIYVQPPYYVQPTITWGMDTNTGPVSTSWTSSSGKLTA